MKKVNVITRQKGKITEERDVKRGKKIHIRDHLTSKELRALVLSKTKKEIQKVKEKKRNDERKENRGTP